jgi:predicted porin
MKKSVLALAVAAAVGASGAVMADTTLYGSARVSLDYVKDKVGTAGVLVPETYPSNLVPGPRVIYPGDLDRDRSVWDVTDNSSRLGVRGSEDLGNGLSAIYQFEFGVDTSNGNNLVSNRPKWVGLKSDSWGSVKLGTQWTPYYNIAGATDQFNSTRVFTNFNANDCLILSNPATGNTLTRTTSGDKCGTVYLGPFRYDNAVTYMTPNWNGFSAEAMVVMNGDQENASPATIKSPVTIPATTQLGFELDENNQPVYQTDDNGNVIIDPSTGQPIPQVVFRNNAAETIDPNGDRKTGIDDWQVNLKYQNGPWYAGAAYERIMTDQDSPDIVPETLTVANTLRSLEEQTLDARTNRFVVGLGYNTDVWGLNFNFEQSKDKFNTLTLGERDFTVRNYYVVGRYTYGNNVFRAAYGYLDPRDLNKIQIGVGADSSNVTTNDDGNIVIDDPLTPQNGAVIPPLPDGSGFAPIALEPYPEASQVNNFVVGWQYNFSNRSRLWLEYYAKRDTNSGKTPFGNQYVVYIGVRHDF